MRTDFLLAALHHLLVYGLVAMLVAEAVLLRAPRLTGDTLHRLARLDAGYGISALLLLGVGLARIGFGLKGHDFYAHNPWFWAKLGTFLLVGLLSIAPTLRFLRWRRALRADPAFEPAAAELSRMRGLLRVQLGLLALVFVFAAAMARHGGL
ncbi:MAG TPA: DUF2214 family protein [Lysobacter sp.]|nr:DUF2214 family protein [Lysobacter sp.]